MPDKAILVSRLAKEEKRDSSLADVLEYKLFIGYGAPKYKVDEPDPETVRRLNELAKKKPFSTYARNKKYDPL